MSANDAVYTITRGDITAWAQNYIQSAQPLDYDDKPVGTAIVERAVELSVTNFLDSMKPYPDDVWNSYSHDVEEWISHLLKVNGMTNPGTRVIDKVQIARWADERAAQDCAAAALPDTRPESLAEVTRDPLDPARGVMTGIVIGLVLLLSAAGGVLVLRAMLNF